MRVNARMLLVTTSTLRSAHGRNLHIVRSARRICPLEFGTHLSVVRRGLFSERQDFSRDTNPINHSKREFGIGFEDFAIIPARAWR